MKPRGREAKKLSKQQNNKNRVKNLAQIEAPDTEKSLARRQAEEGYLEQFVQWSVRAVDLEFEQLDCRWDLSPGELNELLQFLEDLSKKTWTEVLAETDGKGRRKHHTHNPADLHPTAKSRLREIGMAGEEKIFRFRVKGTLRLWGFRIGPVFRILWYDPKHQVYPVEKRNT